MEGFWALVARAGGKVFAVGFLFGALVGFLYGGMQSDSWPLLWLPD